MGEYPGYSVIGNRSEEYMIWIVPGRQNYVFSSDVWKSMLCKMMGTLEMKLPREYALFKNGNMRHAGGEWKGNQGLRYYLYPIPGNVNLQDVVAFRYRYLMEHEVWSKCKALLGNMNPLWRTHEKKALYTKASKDMITVEKTGDGTNL